MTELKIGKHYLNESLSWILFHKINQWHYENFGEVINIEKCQVLLIEYDFVIDWVYHKDEEFGCKLIHFFITIKNSHILKTKLNDAYYEFEFVNVTGHSINEDDLILMEIMEEELSKN